MNRMNMLAALAALTLGAAPAHALGGAGESYKKCVQHVVEACNASARPERCTAGGLNGCKNLHSGKTTGTSGSSEGVIGRPSGGLVFGG